MNSVERWTRALRGLEDRGGRAIVIPEGAGPGNPQFLLLIFLLPVIRLFLGAPRGACCSGRRRVLGAAPELVCSWSRVRAPAPVP